MGRKAASASSTMKTTVVAKRGDTRGASGQAIRVKIDMGQLAKGGTRWF
jgi:hypothetical protein